MVARYHDVSGATTDEYYYNFTASGDTPDYVRNASWQIAEKYIGSNSMSNEPSMRQVVQILETELVQYIKDGKVKIIDDALIFSNDNNLKIKKFIFARDANCS